MQQFIIILILSMTISSCSWVHKIDIEQGNIFNDNMIQRLHPGMNENEVKAIMGTPVLLNTFNENRITYIYTMKPGGKEMTEKSVVLIFNQHGVLKEIHQESHP